EPAKPSCKKPPNEVNSHNSRRTARCVKGYPRFGTDREKSRPKNTLPSTDFVVLLGLGMRRRSRLPLPIRHGTSRALKSYVPPVSNLASTVSELPMHEYPNVNFSTSLDCWYDSLHRND